MDDLDVVRSDPRTERSILDSLAWLGIDHDGPVRRQATDLTPYRAALQDLAQKGLVFTCSRSRRELRAAAEAIGAPHEDGTNVVSTASMRPTEKTRWGIGSGDLNHRLKLDPIEVVVEDRLLGTSRIDPAARFGDPILWTRRDVPAYQLASVVDDIRFGVTDVVRGEDLVGSAALQQHLCRLLGGKPPDWWHLPLILDSEGRRLSKRDGDLTLDSLRAAGTPAERVIGLIACSTGLRTSPVPMKIGSFLEELDPDRLSTWAKAGAEAGGHRLETKDLNWLMQRTP